MLEGIKNLIESFEKTIKKTSYPIKILEVAAHAYVNDLLKLSKPKSKITSAKYTHLVDSFAYAESRVKKGEIEVGWKKYYGPFVENGTKFMKAQPHLTPLFNKNKEKYFNLMKNEL